MQIAVAISSDARVVATLAHVYMVVGVYWLLRTTLSTEDFNSAVRDDLLHLRSEGAHARQG